MSDVLTNTLQNLRVFQAIRLQTTDVLFKLKEWLLIKNQVQFRIKLTPCHDLGY